MELKHYFILLKRWWWLAVLLAALGAVAGLIIIRTQHTETVYRASTTVQIYQAPGALPDASEVSQGQRVAETYAELLQQRPVLEQVIANLSLAMTADDLRVKIDITQVGNTNLMRLTVTDQNPERAAAIANEVISVFVEQNVAVQAGRYASSLENLQSEMERVQTDIATTEDQLAPLTENLQATLTPSQVEDRNHLQSLLADYRSSYSILLDRYEQIRLAQTQATDRVSVVEQALPGTPVRSSVQQTVPLQGAIVGLVLAVGIALLIDYLDDTIHNKDELERLTGVPVMGIVSVINPVSEPQDVLVAVHDPRSTVAEAYRLLGTNLEFATSEEAVRSLIVTSSTPQEGKSTTAANLAISLAQGGWQVVLVDMDLRRPTLHKLFEINNQNGLSVAVLQPSSGVIEHLSPAAVDNLYVMTSGPIPPNASDVLRSARMVEVLQELKAHADIVILDTPPLMVVADPILVARLTDAMLLIVQAEATRSGVLKQALEILEQSGTRLLGTVLNQVKSRGDGSYYYYDYYYYEDASVAGKK